MKKFLMVGALVLSVTLLSQQRAAAWNKFSLFVGLGVTYEGANNSTLWGLFNNGQVPGYPTDAIHGHGMFNFGPPVSAPYYGPAYPDSGYGYPAPVPEDGYGHPPAGSGQTFPPTPKQIPEGKKEEKKQEARLSWYGNPNYQPAVYYYQSPTNTAPVANYTPAANYYQPSPYSYNNYGYYQGYGYSYGGQQVPSYWYGY